MSLTAFDMRMVFFLGIGERYDGVGIAL